MNFSKISAHLIRGSNEVAVHVVQEFGCGVRGPTTPHALTRLGACTTEVYSHTTPTPCGQCGWAAPELGSIVDEPRGKVVADMHHSYSDNDLRHNVPRSPCRDARRP